MSFLTDLPKKFLLIWRNRDYNNLCEILSVSNYLKGAMNMIDANAVLKSYQKKLIPQLQSIKDAMSKKEYESAQQMIEELVRLTAQDAAE